MAIPAIYAVITDVMFVAKLNRLLLFNISSGKPRRSGDLRKNKKRRTGKYHAGDHADPRNVVRTLRKKLCHCPISLTASECCN
jgi:hypothetical protein